MASDTSRKSIDITFHTLTVPMATSGSYGLQFQGSSPVMVCDVVSRSSAERSGIKSGDFLVQLNGNDIQRSSKEAVLTIIKYSQGSPLEVRIGRPRPRPKTEEEKKRAVSKLQTKLAAGTPDTKEVADYRQAVTNAFLEVQDILGSLGVKDDVVEVPYYDSDELSSPPPSEGSDKDRQVDPLLDFSRDDDLVHQPGTEVSGAHIMRNMFEASNALRGMKEIIQDVNEAKERKKLKERRELVSTETTFTPSYTTSESTRTRAQPTAAEPVREKSPSPLREEFQEELLPDENIQWVQSPLSGGQGVTSSAKPKKEQDRSTSKETSKLLFKREKSPPAAVVGTRYQSHVGSSTTPTKYSSQTQSPQHGPPPPIPPYNPEGPERFLLSNKPEYKIERKQVLNTYEPVNKEEVANLQQGRSTSDQQPPSSSMHVPLRVKKKVVDRIPSPEPEGYVREGAGRKNKRSFEPEQISPTLAASGVSDMATACKGLPQDVYEWHKEEVGVWLKQLSPALYEHYFPCFSKHDVTGRTLMRLNASKLKTMGIKKTTDSRTLATEIARLKIQQEATELHKLAPEEEEEAEMSWL